MSWQEGLSRLGPRERRLLNILLVVLAVAAITVVLIVMPRAVMAKRNENQQIREAIDELISNYPALVKAEAQRKAIVARYAKAAPALGAFLDTQARQNGIEKIDENQERPSLPHGKRFDERSTRIQMRKVGLANLAHFMESVERSQYPIIFSRLDIRKRLSESDSYDVELIASAYDRKEAPKSDISTSGAALQSPRGSSTIKAEGSAP